MRVDILVNTMHVSVLWLLWVSDVAALRDFKHHADETNDIFHVAAQVIAHTVLQARALLSAEAATGALLRPTLAHTFYTRSHLACPI